MMGRAEGTHRKKRNTFGQSSRHRMYLGGLDRLGKGQGRQDRGQALCQHRFTRTRRADEQNIMSSRGGDLHRALCHPLTAHIGKIHGIFGGRFFKRNPVANGGRKPLFPVEVLDQRAHIGYRVHRDPLYCRRLGGVFHRCVKLGKAVVSRRHAHTENAAHTAQFSRQRKLAHDTAFFKRDLTANDPRGLENGRQNGGVERRAFLFAVGRSKIDRDPRIGEGIAAVLAGGDHALLCLTNGKVGKSHQFKALQIRFLIALHGHGKTVDPAKPRGIGTGQQERHPHQHS